MRQRGSNVRLMMCRSHVTAWSSVETFEHPRMCEVYCLMPGGGRDPRIGPIRCALSF